ncbi:hypothetical protein TWF751_011318 [Orbilia oligospora]|nr:hypothetical protein TWF751_011318 [Orbilia oligospora]
MNDPIKISDPVEGDLTLPMPIDSGNRRFCRRGLLRMRITTTGNTAVDVSGRDRWLRV